MSRLYDRVLANGCRRATQADFHELADRRIGARDWDDTAARLSELLIGQGAIGQPLNAEQAQALFQAHVRTSRSIVGEDDFPVEALHQCVVIAGDDVGAYINSLGAMTNLGDVCGVVAPPFEWFWIDCRSPNRFSLYSWGVLVHGLDVPPATAQDDERWLLRASLVFETTKGDPWGPVATYRVPVAADGRLWPGDDTGHGSVFGSVASCVGDEEGGVTWSEEMPEFLFAALLSVSFMHCKNVDLVEVEPGEKLSRAFRRRHGRPLTKYWVLDIEPMRRVLARDGEAHERGLHHAIHICRGHFKTFTPDAPLFGKLTGTYWWADHVRGDADEGEVVKDYRIRVETDGIGRTYVEADETPPASPRQVGTDPDLSGRGRAAHNATQNALAAALTAAGRQPLSPRPEDPQFDIAWVTDTDVWVCEVKSLTPQNEMSQMHRAIGQVIDYAHRVQDARPIRKMIAVETQLTSDHWVAECAAQDIVLVWPEGFATAVEAG